MLQYGGSYVFRVQLEDLVPGTGILQNRSSAFSSPYTPATVIAGSGFTLFSQRTAFEAQMGEMVVDDYSHPGYDVNPNPDPTQPDVLSDAVMSAVLGETDYVTTQWRDSNVIVRYPDPSEPSYCAGCNGSYRLGFTSTSVGTATGVFGTGVDVERIIHSFAFTEHPWAFVTLGDGSTASFPLSQGFWGITANRRIQSIHVGLADGSPSGIIYIEIDNLTIGAPRAIGVTIDIKPGSFPNSINLGARGVVPVAILSSATFDALQVDPATVMLGGAAVKRKPHGRLMASAEDVDGDGLVDLVLHVPTEALQLGPTDTEAVLEGATFDGTPIHGVDSVRVVP